MKREEYYSIREAAEAIMCSTVFVRKLLQEKQLPDYRVGNRHFILKQAVQAYINGNIVAAMPHCEMDQ